MKRTFLYAGALALALSTTSALAADSGFYAGVTLGYSNTDIDFLGIGPSYGGTFSDNVDVDGVDYGVLAGYRHHFDNKFFLGAEGEFTFSNADASNVLGIPGYSIEKRHSIGVYAKPGYQFTEQLAAFATLGWKWSKYKETFAGLSDNIHRDGFVFGGGVEYAFTPEISLAGEYNRVALGSDTYDDGVDYEKISADENIFKVALKYHF